MTQTCAYTFGRPPVCSALLAFASEDQQLLAFGFLDSSSVLTASPASRPTPVFPTILNSGEQAARGNWGECTTPTNNMRKASKFFRKALSPNTDSSPPKGFVEKVQASRKLSFTSSNEGGMGMLPDFDPLVVSAFELSELLNAQAITSVEIVEIYLHQIEQHNRRGRQLRALISVAPKHELIKIAKKLDEERLRGKVRGPLHGIPIVLKDNIMTDEKLGMDTTVGALAKLHGPAHD
jgi:hypothetical protein